MKITNDQIKTIANSIAKLELGVEQSSARRRVLRTLNTYVEDAEAIRMELISKYADKKEDKYEKDPLGNFKFSKDNYKKFKKDYAKLSNEVFDFKLSVLEKKDWEIIKEILTDLKAKYTKEKMNAAEFDAVETLQEIIDLI